MKTNLQKLILKFIYGRKTANIDEIIEHIETLIEEEELSENRERKIKPRYVINRTLKTLERSGFIDTYDTEYSTFARLAPEGRQKLRSMKLDEDTSPIPTTWDGKWRIIILDIPENDKSRRNALRYILKKAQFACLKNSVWISPFPFEYMFSNMKSDLGLTDELLVIVTDQLDSDTQEYFYKRYIEG